MLKKKGKRGKGLFRVPSMVTVAVGEKKTTGEKHYEKKGERGLKPSLRARQIQVRGVGGGAKQTRAGFLESD